MAATVEIVFRKDKIGVTDEAPLHIRITKNRKVQYIATGHKIHKRYWDKDSRKVKNTYSNSVRLNHYLNKLKIKYQDEVLQHETDNMAISAQVLKKKISGEASVDFFGVAGMLIEKYRIDGKIRTYNMSRAIVQKLKRFWNRTSLPFEEMNLVFLEKYEVYLKTVLKNKVNTIDKDMRFIRRVFNEANRLETLGNARNPFERYRMKKEKTERVYLTEEELQKIESVPLQDASQSVLFRDMFIFSSYAGGLRVSDILLLQWSNFDGTNINFKIQKTGSQLSIKLPDKAKAIVQKYKRKDSKGQDFIFPVLKKGSSNLDIQGLNKAISSATAYINKNLKIIAEKAGVEKNVSTHIARHTWATRALRKGISIDKVSKLMGHAAIKETQIYAKIVNEELDKAMDIFNS